jgi:adenine-specific DNA-methyltransferase
MQNLLEELKRLLLKDERLAADGNLLKNKIIELTLQLDSGLIKLLLSHASIKKYFFQQVDQAYVFDKNKFQKFVSNKEFLPDSYTSFKNRIGLVEGEDFIYENKSVVLAWPYKDCVLEGNQVSDKEKSNEYFWNEVLAPDEIDRILSPKVLSGFSRVSPKSEQPEPSPSKDDNLLIQGNNLLALYTLKVTHKGRIKLIYIDPPYNTGNDDFGYNDKFNHSSWLTFMKNRLEIAKELLSHDGSIWLNIDDVEAHYLKVLCDEVFGRENFIANIIWQKKFAPQNDAKYFSDTHDHILVYAKNKAVWVPNLLPRSEETRARYKNPDNDPRGPWTSGDLTVKTYSAEYDYPITTPSGKVVNPPKGICWRVSKRKLQELLDDNRIWFGSNGSNVPRLKRFLSDVKDGQTPMTIWPHSEVGHNQEAKQELNKLLETDLFKTPKPERLMKRIIEIGSHKDEFVLDFFAGSGTTAAVALKLNRRFITIEQMAYVKSITKLRLKKVLEGEQGGISKSAFWSGGSTFVFCELLKLNQYYFDLIQDASDDNQLFEILDMMQKKAFLKYQVSNSELSIHNKEFLSLDLGSKKSLLIETLDKNMLYVPYSEIEDADYQIQDEVIQSNKHFFS